jgi:hypothetical protein
VLGDDRLIAPSIHNLGHVALQADKLMTAAARFRESLVIRRWGDLATIRARLDPDAVAVALNNGRAATPEAVERAATRTSSAVTEPHDQYLPCRRLNRRRPARKIVRARVPYGTTRCSWRSTPTLGR